VLLHKTIGEPYQLQRAPVATLDDEEDELLCTELELMLEELLGADEELVGAELELGIEEELLGVELELTTELLDEDDEEADEFKPKKRIASAALTGRL